MKQSIAAIAVLSVLGLTACGEQTEATNDTEQTAAQTNDVVLETPEARQSYSIGASMGSFALSRQKQLVDLDMSLDM